MFKVLLEREKKKPRDVGLLYKVGEKFDDRGMYDEANKRWEMVVRLDPENKEGKSDDALFGLGRSYLSQNDFGQAIKEFNPLISTFPLSDLASDAQLYVGYCYEREGDRDKAIATYRRFVSDHPDADGAKWARKRIGGLTAGEKKKGK